MAWMLARLSSLLLPGAVAFGGCGGKTGLGDGPDGHREREHEEHQSCFHGGGLCIADAMGRTVRGDA